MQPVFYNTLLCISVVPERIVPRARSLPQPLLCTGPLIRKPLFRLPAALRPLFFSEMIRSFAHRYFGTRKRTSLSPAARKKTDRPKAPAHALYSHLSRCSRPMVGAHRIGARIKRRPAVRHARNRGAAPQPHALDRTICQMQKRRLSTGRSGAFCSLSDIYLFIPSCTATATATVAPTIGLLPMPMSPIISTCAGTEEEPANCASECILPIVSVMP